MPISSSYICLYKEWAMLVHSSFMQQPAIIDETTWNGNI